MSLKFFCRYMYICTYQDWLFWLITNIFLLEKEIYWNHKPRITIATKTHISHLYFSFFLSSSFWRQSFPSLSSQYFWLASSWCFFHWPGLHHYLHQLFQQLSFCFPYFKCYSSTITLLWPTSWASFTSPITVIIYNFRFSVTLGKTKTN